MYSMLLCPVMCCYVYRLSCAYVISDAHPKEVLAQSVTCPTSLTHDITTTTTPLTSATNTTASANSGDSSIHVVDTHADDLSLHISTAVRNGRSRAVNSHFVLYYFVHGSTPNSSNSIDVSDSTS